jgi:hypothetical protein
MRAAHGERRGTPSVCARECDVRQCLRVLVFPSGHASITDRLQGSVALLERRLDAARFRPEELGVSLGERRALRKEA